MKTNEFHRKITKNHEISPLSVLSEVLNDPDCSYSVLIVVAAMSGIGGGAFSSSMSSISFFFPKKRPSQAPQPTPFDTTEGGRNSISQSFGAKYSVLYTLQNRHSDGFRHFFPASVTREGYGTKIRVTGLGSGSP